MDTASPCPLHRRPIRSDTSWVPYTGFHDPRRGAALPCPDHRRSPEAPSGSTHRSRHRVREASRAHRLRRCRHYRGRRGPSRSGVLATECRWPAARHDVSGNRPPNCGAGPNSAVFGRTAGNARAACRGNPELASRHRQDRPRHAARRSPRSSATARLSGLPMPVRPRSSHQTLRQEFPGSCVTLHVEIMSAGSPPVSRRT